VLRNIQGLTRILAVVLALVLFGAACGGSSSTSDGVAAAGASASTDETAAAVQDAEDLPVVVVTTNILGDVVQNVVGDQIEVLTIMPVGADPHDFQASARQVAQINDAEVLIANGAGFEEGLLDLIEAAEAEGIPTFEAMSAVTPRDFAAGDSHDDDHGDEEHADEEHGDEHHDDEHGDEHHDDEHGDEEHGDEHHDDDHGDEHGDEHHDDEHGHAHDGLDPHFFTDPARMAEVADDLATFLIANVDGVDADALRASADSYVDSLTALDREVEEQLSAIPESGRVLVTNHEVFGYFAERYDFEVIGAAIPSGSTADGASAAALAKLAELIEKEGVPAIFSDTSSSDQLVQTLADEVGEVSVVSLYSESLGDADSDGATYIDMVRANAERIAAALS